MEWTQFIVEKLNQHFNKLVRLLLFDNIKQSLKVSYQHKHNTYLVHFIVCV